MKKMKVSFDFDETLSRLAIQDYATNLIDKGYDVWIVTSRLNDEVLANKFKMTLKNAYFGNKDLYDVAKMLGIPKDKIIFTNLGNKYHFFLDNNDFLWHLDDDKIELELIRTSSAKVIPIDSMVPDWRATCDMTNSTNI